MQTVLKNKSRIAFNPDEATLNLRTEIFGHCRHSEFSVLIWSKALVLYLRPGARWTISWTIVVVLFNKTNYYEDTNQSFDIVVVVLAFVVVVVVNTVFGVGVVNIFVVFIIVAVVNVTLEYDQ